MAPRKKPTPKKRARKSRAKAPPAFSGREVWAVVSDLHCGSTLGLCPPGGVALDDGGRYLPSKAQLALWDCWRDYWETVKATLRPGDRLIVVLNGDVVDGDHHRTAQIVSKNLAATQHDIAAGCLIPMLAMEPAAKILIRGTEAHVGSSAEFEERLAHYLGCEQDPVTGAFSQWHFQALSQGVLLDFAHHGRFGQRPWTKLTGPGTLASQIIQAASGQGVRAPDVAVRSHYHQWADTADNFSPTRVIQLAGWQLSTAFVHRVAAGSVPQIGGLVVACEDGRADVCKVKFRWKREEPWQLSA